MLVCAMLLCEGFFASLYVLLHSWSGAEAQLEWSGVEAQLEWSGAEAQLEWSGAEAQIEWSVVGADLIQKNSNTNISEICKIRLYKWWITNYHFLYDGPNLLYDFLVI